MDELLSKEIHDLYSSQNSNSGNQTKDDRRSGYVEYMREMRYEHRFGWEVS